MYMVKGYAVQRTGIISGHRAGEGESHSHIVSKSFVAIRRECLRLRHHPRHPFQVVNPFMRKLIPPNPRIKCASNI